MHKQLTLYVVLLVLIQAGLAYWIKYHPADATVELGETASFYVGLDPSRTSLYGFKYKWYLNDREVASGEYQTSVRVVATEELQNARVYAAVYDAHYKDKLLERSNTAFLHITKPKPPPVPELPSLEEFDLPSSVIGYSGEYIELSIPQPPENIPTRIQWSIDGVPLVGQIYPQLRMKVTSELDNVQIEVVVVGPKDTIRRTTILHVYWAKWIVVVGAVAAGVVFLGLVAGIIVGVFVLKKRGYLRKQTTTKVEVAFKPLNQQATDGDQDLGASTELELN